MKSSKPKKPGTAKQLPSPIVLATAWVKWEGKPKKPYSIQRHTRGTSVELAKDGVSAVVTFQVPPKTGFLPVVTPVLYKGRVMQSLCVSNIGSSRTHSVKVVARGMAGAPEKPLSFTIVIVGM